ncbi:MAG: NAD-dependent succinate-semialdehyde dehydrogenase [Oleiphilaceae bacterium]|nr:NAD-dependent succinate-semialdehyde dehydrogenase [Oleiphilaceae bacterium]
MALIDSPLLKHLQGYIGGHWVAADDGGTFTVDNPATGETIAHVAAMGPRETEKAIAAGQSALRLQEPYSIDTRRGWLEAVRDALLSEQKEIGRILCLEHGKPLAEAEGEVAYAAGFFDYCAKNLDRLDSHTIPEKPKGMAWTVHYRPVGVVGLITPWNFPIGMIAKKLSAALAAGCPSVIKPASETPLTMIAAFQAMHDKAGLPAGMVNLVTGPPAPIGDVLCDHPDVPMISFTGSTGIGEHLVRATAHRVKKLSLELGGNAPFIVFDDADLDSALENLMANKFRGGGQTCVCTNRLYVQSGVAETFASKLAGRVSALKVGDGMAEGTEIGPLINQAGFDKVRRHVQDALDQGGTLLAGPDPKELPASGSLFYPPTLVGQVTPGMLCCREETFGPFIPLSVFESEEEVIARSNDTEFGLAAYVFTGDEQRAARTISALRFGHVGWNSGSGPTPEAPFGGMKASGVGREGGTEGLFEFVEPQTVPRGS